MSNAIIESKFKFKGFSYSQGRIGCDYAVTAHLSVFMLGDGIGLNKTVKGKMQRPVDQRVLSLIDDFIKCSSEVAERESNSITEIRRRYYCAFKFYFISTLAVTSLF